MSGSAAMAQASARPRYSGVAMALHWVIAALILVNLTLGWRMGSLSGMAQFSLFQLHKSVGISILMLSVVRLAWRVLNPPPALPAGMKPWEHAGAHVTHWAFYAMMIGMPLSGWAMVSVSPLNIPTLLWSHIPLPHIGFLHALAPAAKASVGKVSDTVHITLAFGGVALIVLHVAAALRHQLVVLDGVLGRIVPFVPVARHQGQ